MNTKEIYQIGILVRDIRQTAARWAALLGRPMPEIGITEDYAVTHAVYRGQPCHGRIYQAAFQLGSVELEFVSPVDDEPSYWKECLDRDGEGLHHLGFRTDSIEDDMQSLRDGGYPIVQTGNWPDTPRDGAYAYADGTDALKCVIELLDFEHS